MGRAPCCDKNNVKRGPWSPEEDAALKEYIEKNGTGGNWIALPQKIGLKRCGKSCRLRWLNYLRPNIKHGGFTEEEDNIICSLYISIGSRWSIIAAQLPGRTDNDIKNYWNTRLKKKLLGRRKQQSNFNSNNQKDTNNNNGGILMDDDNNNNNNNNALSSSALERLQLHLQLQSLQNPFSFYTNNPALWPNKLHPFQEKMIHQTLQQSSHHLNNDIASINNSHVMQNALASPHVEQGQQQQQQKDEEGMMKNPKVDLLLENNAMNSNGSVPFIAPPRGGEAGDVGLHQVCAMQSELDDILNNRTSSSATMGYNINPQVVAAEFDCFREMNGSSKDHSLIWWSNNDSDAKSASSNSWESSTATPVLLPEGMFQDYELGYSL